MLLPGKTILPEISLAFRRFEDVNTLDNNGLHRIISLSVCLIIESPIKLWDGYYAFYGTHTHNK